MAHAYLLFEADHDLWKPLFCGSTNKNQIVEWLLLVFNRYQYTEVPKERLYYLRDSVFFGVEPLYKVVYDFFLKSSVEPILELVRDHPSCSTISQNRVLHGLLFHHLWKRGGKAIHASLKFCKEQKRIFPGLHYPVYAFYPCVFSGFEDQESFFEWHLVSGFKCLEYTQGTLFMEADKEETLLFSSVPLKENMILEERLSSSNFLEDLPYLSEGKKN